MKNLAIFTIFFLASFAIGATPILVGVALVYAVAWFLARNSSATQSETPLEPPQPTAEPLPTFGHSQRKITT